MTRPTAAPAHFPYRHRTMAEVMMSERIEASHRRMLGRFQSTRRPLGDVASASVASTLPGRAGAQSPISFHDGFNAEEGQHNHA